MNFIEITEKINEMQEELNIRDELFSLLCMKTLGHILVYEDLVKFRQLKGGINTW